MIDLDTVRASVAAYDRYDGDFEAMFQAAMDEDGYEGGTDIHYEGADIALSPNGVVIVTLLDVYDNVDDEVLGNIRIGITADKTFLAY